MLLVYNVETRAFKLYDLRNFCRVLMVARSNRNRKLKALQISSVKGAIVFFREGVQFTRQPL